MPNSGRSSVQSMVAIRAPAGSGLWQFYTWIHMIPFDSMHGNSMEILFETIWFHAWKPYEYGSGRTWRLGEIARSHLSPILTIYHGFYIRNFQLPMEPKEDLLKNNKMRICLQWNISNILRQSFREVSKISAESYPSDGVVKNMRLQFNDRACFPLSRFDLVAIDF